MSKKLGWHVHTSSKVGGDVIQLKFGKHVILEHRASIEKAVIFGQRMRTGNIMRQYKNIADQYTASAYEPSSRKEIRSARKSAKENLVQAQLKLQSTPSI